MIIPLLVATAIPIIIGVIIYLLAHFTAFFAYHRGIKHVELRRDIAYTSSGNPKHRLDIYLPKNTHNFPLVQFVHGGYWNSGDKRYRQWLTGLYGIVGVTLARQGIAVVVSNYRLTPEVTVEGQLDDVVNSIAWTLQNAKEWSWNGRFYLMGHSAGGHLVSLLNARSELLSAKGITPNQINGTVALSPVLDVADMARGHELGFNKKITFATFGSEPSKWDSYSPLQQLLNNPRHNNPLMIAYAENDFPYLAKQIPLAAQQLKDRGLHFKFVMVPGYSHSDMVTRFGSRHDVLRDQIINFMHEGSYSTYH